VVERSVEHSIPSGLYDPKGGQAGFARVTGDRAVFAYLGDRRAVRLIVHPISWTLDPSR